MHPVTAGGNAVRYRNDAKMIPSLKQGATLPRPDWPGIETERLILRQWRASDVVPNTAMLSDPLSGRFITADGKPDVIFQNTSGTLLVWTMDSTSVTGTASFKFRARVRRQPGYPFTTGSSRAVRVRVRGL